MHTFKTDNTEGYSIKQLNKLNKEWNLIVMKYNLIEFTDNYNFMLKKYQDNVARRM